MYQPAYAAEQRFAAHLKQQQEEKRLSTAQQLEAAVAAAIQQAPQPASSSSSSGSSSPKQQLPDASESGEQSQPQLTAAEQMQQVPDAAKDMVREIMHEDNKQRTKQLVDDAWQTLE
jgi:hypothetical protein